MCLYNFRSTLLMAFKNLQFLLGNSRMEEDLLPTDETNDGVEVTADIAVKVAEDNDAADALSEDLDAVDSEVTEQEEVLDDVELLDTSLLIYVNLVPIPLLLILSI